MQGQAFKEKIERRVSTTFQRNWPNGWRDLYQTEKWLNTTHRTSEKGSSCNAGPIKK